MRVLTLILTGLICGAAPARVQADPITLSGSGPLFLVFPELQGFYGLTAGVGDTVRFSLTFDNGSPRMTGRDTPGNIGYDLGPGHLNVAAGVSTVSIPVSIEGWVGKDLPWFENELPTTYTADQLFLRAHGPRPLTSFDLFGQDFGDWLTTDAWPTDVAAVLNAGPALRYFAIAGGHDNLRRGAVGDLLNVTQTPDAPVPEPATILLLGTGLAGVATRRWRQKRQHVH